MYSHHNPAYGQQQPQQQQPPPPPPPPMPLPSNPSGSSQQQQQQQHYQQQGKQPSHHHSYATSPAPLLQDPFHHHHLHHLVHPPPPQSLSPSTPNPKNNNNNNSLPPSVSIPPPVHHLSSSETYQEKYIRALEERLVAAREISERDFIIRERDAIIRERDSELRRIERDVVAPLQDENKRLIDLNRRLEERIAQLEKVAADQHALDMHRPLIPTSQPAPPAAASAVGMAMDPPHSGWYPSKNMSHGPTMNSPLDGRGKGGYVPAMPHQLPPVDLVAMPNKPLSVASEGPDNRPSRTPDPEPEDMDPLNASPGVAWTSVLRKLFPGSLSQLRPAQRTQIESAVKDYLVNKLGPERAAESKVRGLGRSTSLVDAIPSELHADFADWFGQQIESGLLSSSSSTSSGGKRKRSSLGASAPWTTASATSPVSSTDADSKRAKTMLTPTSSGPVILGPRYPRDLMAWTDLVRTRYPSFNANVPQMSIFTKSFLKSRGIPDQRYPALNTNKMAWAIPQRYWDEYLEKFEENFPYMAYMRKEKQQQQQQQQQQAAEAGQRDESEVHVPSKRMLKPPPRDSDRPLDKRADRRNEMPPPAPHPDPALPAGDNGGDGFSGGPAERVMQRHTHSASASPLGSPLLSRGNSGSASGPTAPQAPSNSPVNVLAYTSPTGPQTTPLTVWTELIRKRYPAYLEAASKPLWNRIRTGVRVFLETVMPAYGVTVDGCLASVGKGRKTYGVPDIVEEAFWKWFEEKMKTDFDSFPSSSSRISSPQPHLEAKHHHEVISVNEDDNNDNDNIEKSPHPSGVRKITLKNNAPPPPLPPSRGPRNGDITLLPNVPSHASSSASSSSLAIPASPKSPRSLHPPHPHAPVHHHQNNHNNHNNHNNNTHRNHPSHHPHYQHSHHHHHPHRPTTHIRHASWEAEEEEEEEEEVASPKATTKNPFTQDTADNDQDDDGDGDDGDDDGDDDDDDEATPSDSDENDADDEAARRTTLPANPTSTTDYDPKPIRYNQ
ncbi:hypothetical protein, variant [Spizellomyces punctatus DAOM BR117]|uniref:Uncharacterized protein n=1 Tax=Spizellomyces punctatus (strain DAOM BR117) TaxID=645134 RepID=A0A0L0HAW2_SPIPD|nr:hypothetical protein, variant [Spizellomyces punctatus DAOM BR117]KNC98337.1 hypothetical protein, variant [Spizellomyces punctatus DAOM BR117]|eukprot:XP_016606377.1 hypothetical protein, variant [Spizellomyces punctatus DAOM BR117]